MSDETHTAAMDPPPPVEMVGVSVVNTAHAGYRRAGFVLQQGENTLPSVTLSALQALEADPRLSVTVIAADPDDNPKGGLDNQDPTDEVNTLRPVTLAELQALEADPRLSVTVIAANPDDDPKGELDNQDSTDEAKEPSPPTEQPPPANGNRGKK